MAKSPKYDSEGVEVPEEPAKLDPMVILASLAASIDALAKNQANSGGGNTELMQKLTSAMDRIADAQLQGAQLQASETRRAHRPSNEVNPQVSPFNRRGVLLPDYQKPKLKCLMMLPWLAEWESLTREEVELLNLLEPGTFTITRVDRTKIKNTVRIEYGVDEVTPSRLLLNHETAFNNDNFRLMPPLADMLRQMLKQQGPESHLAAESVMTDDEEEALIAVGELTVSV